MLFSLSKNNILNLLFFIIPISFILGNLTINLNVLLIIIFTIIFYNKEIFRIKIHFFDKLILFLFFYILLVGIFNSFDNFNLKETSQDYTILIKTLFYLRFLFFYFIIRFLIEKNVINFKAFFIIATFCSIFISLDMIYQLILGKDIFGYKIDPRRISGLFGEEKIAGSYLQRFSIFSIFFLYFFPKLKKDKILNLALFIFIPLIAFCIIVSGNKMPFILFLFIISLIILFEKEMKKHLIGALIIIPFLFIILFKYNEHVRDNYGNYIHFTKQFVNVAATLSSDKDTEIFEDKNRCYSFSEPGKEIENCKKDHPYYMNLGGKKIEMKNPYMKEFYAGYQTWGLNKFFGGGVRSYRVNCPKTDVINCGRHPHNYYLEILAELGVLGVLILVILYIKMFYKYFSNSSIKSKFIIIPFIYLFIAEIFPIKSTGSFFSASNSTYIFLILSVTISLLRRKNIN